MGLKGDLLSADLSNVFQMLALNRKRGRLTVQDQSNLLNRRELFLTEDKQVALVHEPPSRPLEALLVQCGAITWEQLCEARRRCNRNPDRCVETLRTLGYAGDAELAAARKLGEEEDVLEIFLWRTVRFTLEEGAEPPVGRPTFNLDLVVMEAARRQDEWLHATLHGEAAHAIFRKSPEAHENLRLDPIHQLVLDRVDGLSGRTQIMETTGLSRYFVDLSLKALEEHGFVYQIGLKDLVDSGDQLLDAGRHGEAVRLFRAALRHDRHNLTIHQRLASAYLSIGQPAKAASHYRFCAVKHAEIDDVRAAVDFLEQALDLLPTDFATIRRATGLLAYQPQLASPDDQPLLDVAKRLMNLDIEVERPREGLLLCEDLLKLRPEDQDLVEAAARLRLRNGNVEAAVQAYDCLAAAKVKAGDHLGALEILRTNITLDPGRKSRYEDRIHSIQRTLDGKRRRRRGARALVSFAVLAGLAVFGWTRYTDLARERLAPFFVEEAEDSAGLRTLAERLRNEAKTWPFSPAARKAEGRAVEWETRAQTLEAEEDARRKDDEARRERLLRRAEGQLDAAGEAMARGDLRLALEKYRAALESFESSRLSWLRAAEARQGVLDVGAYLERGDAALEKLKTLRDEGRDEEAFAALLTFLREAPLHPDAKTTLASRRLEVAPPEATATLLSSGELKADGTLVTPCTETIHLRVEAEGYQTREIELPASTGHRASVTLRRLPAITLPTGLKLAAIAPAGPDRIAILGRDGRGATLELQSASLRPWKRSPLYSLDRAVPVGKDRLLLCSGEGSLRLVRAEDGHLLWQDPSRRDSRVRDVFALGDRLVVLWDDGALRGFGSSDGQLRWESEPARGGFDATARANDRLLLRLANGDAVLVTLQSGATLQTVPGPCALPLALDGRLYLPDPKGGMRVVEKDQLVPAGENGPLASSESRRFGLAAGGRLILSGRRATLVQGEVRHELLFEEPILDLLTGDSDFLVVAGSKRLFVVDRRRGRTLFGLDRGPLGAAGICLHAGRLVVTREGGDIEVHPLGRDEGGKR